MMLMGIPIAAIASVAAIRTPGQARLGMPALIISALEALALLGMLFLMRAA